MEYMILDLSKHDVEFHPELRKDFSISQKMKTVLSLDSLVISQLFPPVFIKKADKYYLIGRYWAYAIYLDAGLTEILSVIIRDNKTIATIQKYEHMDQFILKKLSSRKDIVPITTESTPVTRQEKNYKSRKSISIAKSLKKGRVCPFSGSKVHALSTPKRSGELDKNGLIHLRCINRSKGCDFDGMVTPYELILLKKREYPTDKWLTEIPDSLCPSCKSSRLFKRVLRHGKTSVATYSVCRNYFSISTPCHYIEQIKG